MPKLRERKVEEPLQKEKQCNFYGEIPGIKVGTVWGTRAEISEVGVHRPTVGRVHGGPEGAYSIILSSPKDAQDDGETIIYFGCLSGSGGESQGLSSLVKSQKSRLPLRVVRGHKAKTGFSPDTGYRYDGLYKVVESWTRDTDGQEEQRFKMVRLEDQEAPPWEGDFGREEEEYEPHIINSRHIRIQERIQQVIHDNKPKEDPEATPIFTIVTKKRKSEEDSSPNRLSLEKGGTDSPPLSRETSPGEDGEGDWRAQSEFINCEGGSREQDAPPTPHLPTPPMDPVDPFVDPPREVALCGGLEGPIIGNIVSLDSSDDMEPDPSSAVTMNNSVLFGSSNIRSVVLVNNHPVKMVRRIKNGQYVVQNCLQMVNTEQFDVTNSDIRLVEMADGEDDPIQSGGVIPTPSDGEMSGEEEGVEEIHNYDDYEPEDDEVEYLPSDDIKVCIESKPLVTASTSSANPSQLNECGVLDMSLRDLLRTLQGSLFRGRGEGSSFGESERSRISSILSAFDGRRAETPHPQTPVHVPPTPLAIEPSISTAEPAPHVCCGCAAETGKTTVDVGTQCDRRKVMRSGAWREHILSRRNARRAKAVRGVVDRKLRKMGGGVVKVEVDPEDEVVVWGGRGEAWPADYREEWAQPHVYTDNSSFDKICNDLCTNISENPYKKPRMRRVAAGLDSNQLIARVRKEKRRRLRRRRRLPQEGFNGFGTREISVSRSRAARHYGNLIEYSDFHGWPSDDENSKAPSFFDPDRTQPLFLD